MRPAAVGVAPEPSDRPHAAPAYVGREPRSERRICAVPLHLSTAKAASDANYLERIAQLRPGHHPGRPGAGDGAEGPRLRRLLPDAAPRVRDADQAEALVPGARARGDERRARQGLGGLEGPVRDRRGRRPRGDRAARHLARDRDLALRPARRGRPDLLRPHVLPRAGERGGAAPALRAAAERDEGDRHGRDRPLRAPRQRELLPDPPEGRRARARDALPRRGRPLAGRDRRGGRGRSRSRSRSSSSRAS